MTLDDLLTLSRAGYTKAEIMAFMEAEKKPAEPAYEPKHEAKPEPKDEPKPEPKPEPDALTKLQADIAALRNEFHKQNIAGTEQPPVKTVDDILAEAMKGGRF